MGKNRVNNFVEESFTNSIGQTLKPGDKVICVSTGYGHRVDVFPGVFEGTYRSPKNNITGTRVGQVPVEYRERVFSENGSEEETKYVGYVDYHYKYEKTGRRYDWVLRLKHRTSSLRLNRVFKIDTNLSEIKI
jgi:hypothetical protein